MERAAPTRRSAALALASPAVQRESGAWTECAAQRVYRMAGTALLTASAVAETAPTAYVVHLVGSGSATAHARCLAAVPKFALIAAALVLAAQPLTLVEPSAGGTALICVPPTAPVLLGRFVLVAPVLWRARGSAYQGLGAI